MRAGRARSARDTPALAWIAGSIHSNEPSGADADMRLLYELAARRDCDNARRLQRLIVVVMPVQNPDGRAVATRTNANGFDLNRDWFAATQPETQTKLRLLEQAPPMLFVDQHEQGGNKFFFPPNADPVNHELPAQALDAIAQTYGPALRAAFSARHFAYESNGTYDLFYPGFGDSASTLAFGAAGMTFEAGDDQSLPRRVTEHFTAASAALDAADAQARAAARVGRSGSTQRAQGQRGACCSTAISRACSAMRSARGPSRSVARMMGEGAAVRQLAEAAAVASLRPYGSPAPGARRRWPPGPTW